MIWYLRLGAFIVMTIVVAPFILKFLKLKDQEEPKGEKETTE